MLAAVLSDIHSNVFALQAVLRDAELSDVSEFWVCGDIFGYYPWASDCFLLLRRKQPVAVLGNHDSWLVDSPSAPAQIAGDIARHNARELASHSPAALDWLAALPSTLMFERCGGISPWRMAHLMTRSRDATTLTIPATTIGSLARARFWSSARRTTPCSEETHVAACCSTQGPWDSRGIGTRCHRGHSSTWRRAA